MNTNQETFFETNDNSNLNNNSFGIRAKVIGVGGAGISLVDGLRFDNFDFVDNLIIDVDIKAVADSLASQKLTFGRRHTRGMGTGGDVNLGKRLAEEEKDKIRKELEGVDLVFLLAGLGGGVGGGAAPVVARLAREHGALVFAFTPLPFSWEKTRHAQAEECLSELRKHANAVIPLPNDSLLQMGGEDSTALECFAEAGRNVSRGIAAICNIVFKKGMIDVDFSYLRKVFSGRGGRTLFGYGKGSGKEGLREALRDLLVCPMLHMPDVSKAADILLIFIQGGTSLSMSGLQSVSKEIRDSFKAGEDVVFGAHVDENLGEEVKITILGVTSLDPLVPTADVAPVAQQVLELGKNAKQSHRSKLEITNTSPEKTSSMATRKKRGRNIDNKEQNTFFFMEAENQRGIFDDLPSRNMYEGEDLDVPSYLRRGVKIVI
ncbi:MAG: cell division protein FtsZ [Opitutales bacterium]|nr:cell division protein FtsZ [Opitutales bacterium]